MNGVTSSLLFFVFVIHGCLTLSLAASDSDNSLNDLYENLLQREYTGPISFPNHQVERKAQRSPSLRLRFGRRSDPSMSIFDKRFSDEINQKPIRSPSLRLRFGKRDPSLSYENHSAVHSKLQVDLKECDRLRTNIVQPQQLPKSRRKGIKTSEILKSHKSVIEKMDYFSNDVDMRRELRAPSPRLRWGRRNDPDVPILGDDSSFNELDVQPEKRKPVRLRWGRSYIPGTEELSDTHPTSSDNVNEQNTPSTGSRLGF